MESIRVLIDQPLRIKCNGHGTRQMCGTDKFGFPTRHRSNKSSHFGFQTGDIVKAIVDSGKYSGIHVGKISVRARPSFKLNADVVFDVHPRKLTILHRKDGYSYDN
jgi:hypothetical protein